MERRSEGRDHKGHPLTLHVTHIMHMRDCCVRHLDVHGARAAATSHHQPMGGKAVKYSSSFRVPRLNRGVCLLGQFSAREAAESPQ